MWWRVLMLVCGFKCIVQEPVTLLPKVNKVLENSSLELTCYAPNATDTRWRNTLHKAEIFSNLYFSTEGLCNAVGFLNETKYFETTCYSNATFKVKIKHVNMSYQGQKWYCSHDFEESNAASIAVHVPPSKPVLYLEKGNHNINKTLYVIRNDTITIMCRSFGDTSLYYKWTGQHQGSKLHIPSIQTNTNETCTASNKMGRNSGNVRTISANTSVSIVVSFPPGKPYFQVIWQNELAKNGTILKNKIILEENSSFTVICKADGYPPPTCNWTVNRASGSPSLPFIDISKDDIGMYRCCAENTIKRSIPAYEVEKSSSTNLEIDVLYAPRLSPEFIPKLNLSSARGIAVSFEFKAVANPIAMFHWFKSNGSFWDNVRASDKYKINTTELYSRLTVRNITLDDFGCYNLRIKNKVGSMEQSYFLKANETPDPPTVFVLLNEFVTERSTILRWTPGFNGGIDQIFILRYKLYLGRDWVNVSIPDVGSKTMNYTLNGLERGSVYSIELFAVNTEGKSRTVILKFKTKDSPSLTEKRVHGRMYLIYTCAGVILIVALFVVTTFTRKRLKQQSANTDTHHIVPFGVPETSNIYQNVSFITQLSATEDNRHAFPTKEVVENDSQAMTKQQDKKVFQNQEDQDLELEESYSEVSEYYNILEIINRLEKLKVTELYEYVRGRADESFTADFQKIPSGMQMPCLFARKPENIALNRYRGILPYDHTRVYINDQPDFFINASYIDGYMKPKAYIACLGPTAATHDNFKTFWKMVWYEKSELIVMVTNLNEQSSMKCEQYWPDPSQDEMYGDILVSCQKIEMFAEYTIRSFEVTKTTNTKKYWQSLVHLHYTAWPDKKTPEDAASLLEFRQIFHQIRKTAVGPVIVHCSAGIGRTGVFIAIDKLLMEGKNEGSVNVVACITKMREQRVKMVQTCEQYKFIFQALAYAFHFDCGPIPIESLTNHTKILDGGFYDRQYKDLKLSLEGVSKEQLDSRAKNESYNDKNRHGADIPENANREYLYLNRSYDDSDYINAVFINSYICKDHFIMAQSPLPSMESDFLTMIYQENCVCVVSMEDFNDHGMKIGKYLPEDNQSFEIGSFTVSCFINDSKPQYTVRKITIKNTDQFTNGEWNFYHFQYETWTAENDIPLSTEDFVEFVKDVQEYAKLGDESSHVLVHCLKANERSGLFCAIATIREKLLFDEQVSIFNTLRHLRSRRPTAITSMEQLRFCYKAAVVIAQRQNEGIYVNNSVMI